MPFPDAASCPYSGLYFGTFNPIHNGHLMIAQAILNPLGPMLGIDRLCFIPTGVPHRTLDADLAPAAHRFNMVALAIANHPRFVALDDEITCDRPAYTIDTLEHLRDRGRIRIPVPLIIGSDALSNLADWKRAEDLCRLACFLQMPRPGVSAVHHIRLNDRMYPLNTRLIDMPALSLSSSWVRAEMARHGGDSGCVRYFVPDPVRRYIRDNHLYGLQ